MENLTDEDFKEEIASGAFRVQGKDKMGRPLIWLRVRFIKPEKSTAERMALFTSYIFDKAVRSMGEKVD